MKSSRLNCLPAFIIALLCATLGCRRSTPEYRESNASSLIFGTASPDAQQALATPVDFRLTEDNFAQWEAAQKYLDALPRSALPSGESSAGNVIDRAVQRLESSPRARTAIERTGLTVRDFVLETIALAQATEAITTSNSPSAGQIPPENLRFVQAHQARMLATRRRPEMSDEPENTDSGMTEPENMQMSPAPRLPDTAGAQNEERSEIGVQQGSEQTAPPRDTLRSPRPQQDSVRDTIPPPTQFTGA